MGAQGGKRLRQCIAPPSRDAGQPGCRQQNDDHPKTAAGVKPCTEPGLADGQAWQRPDAKTAPGMTYALSPLREIPQRGTGDVTAAELGHPKPGASLPTAPKTRLQSPRGSWVRWKFNPRDGWSGTERRDERGRRGDTGPGVFCQLPTRTRGLLQSKLEGRRARQQHRSALSCPCQRCQVCFAGKPQHLSSSVFTEDDNPSLA